jgi:peptidoglycan hydrolase CwlO-like protein
MKIMTTFEMVELFIGSGGLIGIIFIFFRMGKFAQKIESMDDNCKKEFIHIHTDIKEIRHSVNALEKLVSKLETRVEERTMRMQPYERDPVMR